MLESDTWRPLFTFAIFCLSMGVGIWLPIKHNKPKYLLYLIPLFFIMMAFMSIMEDYYGRSSGWGMALLAMLFSFLGIVSLIIIPIIMTFVWKEEKPKNLPTPLKKEKISKLSIWIKNEIEKIKKLPTWRKIILCILLFSIWLLIPFLIERFSK